MAVPGEYTVETSILKGQDLAVSTIVYVTVMVHVCVCVYVSEQRRILTCPLLYMSRQFTVTHSLTSVPLYFVLCVSSRLVFGVSETSINID